MLWVSRISKIFKRPKETRRIVVNVIDDNYIKDFILEWNLKYPIDRWWREKHSIAFNSPVHRAVSLIDMRIEFEEERMFRKMRSIQDYTPNTGDWFKGDIDDDELLTEEERIAKYKKEFEDIESQYND